MVISVTSWLSLVVIGVLLRLGWALGDECIRAIRLGSIGFMQGWRKGRGKSKPWTIKDGLGSLRWGVTPDPRPRAKTSPLDHDYPGPLDRDYRRG